MRAILSLLLPTQNLANREETIYVLSETKRIDRDRCASPTGMVTTGFLPSRDTCTSLYIVGEGREQDAEASPARIAARTPLPHH